MCLLPCISCRANTRPHEQILWVPHFQQHKEYCINAEECGTRSNAKENERFEMDISILHETYT